MPATNNEKYIAEIWLENGEEEDFKKSFLESLMLQWQHHREKGDEDSGFCADRLDGKHYTDILKDIEDATEDLIPEFKLGGVNINRENIEDRNGELKLGFDAIQLYIKKPECDDYEDGYYPNFALLPWEEGYEDITRDWDLFNGCDGPNLLQAFEELYQITEGKVDWETFNEVKDMVDDLDELGRALRPNVKIIYDADGEVIGSEINAASINGLYIYIMGKAEYNALDDEIKNDVHNLFIIKENENAFDDFLKAKQPNTAKINKYYHFRVITKVINKTTGEVLYIEPNMDINSILNNMTGDIEIEKWLQYKHEDLTEWRDMCKVTDFLDFGTIEKALIQVLEESTVYTINKEALLNSFKEIDIDFDTASFPFLNYFRNNFVAGAQSENFKLNSSDSKYLPTVNVGKLKYLNLDNFGQAVLNQSKSYVNNKFESICELGCITHIDSMARQALTLTSQHTNKINEFLYDRRTPNSFPSVYEMISSLRSDLDEVMGEWKSYTIRLLTDGNGVLRTKNYYNESLGLAILQCSFASKFKTIPKATWLTPCRTESGVPYPYTVVKAVPDTTYSILNATHPENYFIAIDGMGRILVRKRNDTTSNDFLHCGGTILYKFNKLYTDEEIEKVSKLNNSSFKYDGKKWYYIDYNGSNSNGLIKYSTKTDFWNKINSLEG